jgi:hypothetical protein
MDLLSQVLNKVPPTMEKIFDRPDRIANVLNIGNPVALPAGMTNMLVNPPKVEAKPVEEPKKESTSTKLMGKLTSLKDKLLGKNKPVATTGPEVINPLPKATLTVYNPEEIQTDKDPWIGGFNTKMQFGDVAVANRDEYNEAKNKFIKDKKDTFIEVPELSNIKTPYGNGVFRIRDTMNERFDENGENKLDIFIPDRNMPEDMTVRKTPKATYRILSDPQSPR